MYFTFFIVICVGIILLILQQQGKLPSGKVKHQLPALERNIFNLEIGDLVQYQGIDWFVEGKLIYHDSSDTWFSYLLQNDAEISWLSVEEDDVVEVTMLRQVSGDIPNPPPRNLTFLGTQYYICSTGTAKMQHLGNTLNRQEQTCNYYDYKDEGNNRLSVEIWGEDVEISIGEKVNPRMFTFLPGDGQKVYG